MTKLTLQNISKSFDQQVVLDGISMEVHGNQLIALLGESGAGKSTLLRIIAGFDQPDKGEILLDGEVLANETIFVKPEYRGIGVIFQDYALFPHLSVKKNIAFGVSKSVETDKHVDQLLDIFELKNQAHKKPSAISGGQQQRVAIARALAAEPKLLLLDEPFSNLDQTLKRKIRNEIIKTQKAFDVPMVLVTHEPEDAMKLADKIAVLQEGRIVQFDTPEQLYYHPVNEYVAGLFGEFFNLNDQFLRPEHVDFTVKEFEGKVIETFYDFKGSLLSIEVDGQIVKARNNQLSKVEIGQQVSFGIKKSKS